MKRSKTILIGFILLWVVVFLVLWGRTMFKKGSTEAKTPTDIASVDGVEGKKEKDASISQPDQDAVPVRCYRVSRIDFKDDLPVMGTIKAAVEINLKFEINGVIESINFREGDLIYKGDLIATLDKKDAQLKVNYAESKLATSKVQTQAAKKKLEIFKSLYEIGGIIKAKLEEIELEVKSAELQQESADIELLSADAELEKTNLFAPRDGVLGSKDVEVGEFVTPNDKTATLYDTENVFVELGIVEKDIDKIALDQRVTLSVDAHQGEVFTGAVDNVFPVIEGKSRTLTVKVSVDNQDVFLLPGMFARAMITVAEFTDALVIPSMSLNRTDEGYKLFVVGDNDTLSSRIVQVAYVTTDYTVIEFGIYEDEIIVVDTPQELKDGMTVNVIEVQEAGGE